MPGIGANATPTGWGTNPHAKFVQDHPRPRVEEHRPLPSGRIMHIPGLRATFRSPHTTSGAWVFHPVFPGVKRASLSSFIPGCNPSSSAPSLRSCCPRTYLPGQRRPVQFPRGVLRNVVHPRRLPFVTNGGKREDDSREHEYYNEERTSCCHFPLSFYLPHPTYLLFSELRLFLHPDPLAAKAGTAFISKRAGAI
jgi:hypothetical protein